MGKQVIGSRWWVLGLSLVLFPFYGGCYAQTGKNIVQEEQAQDPRVWDFGKVEEGQVFKHEFILKNDSGKVLNIKAVNTSCGCTISEIEKKMLAPQESAKVKVEFKSKGYSGKVQQFVYVNTDSVDEPIIRFVIKAEVIK